MAWSTFKPDSVEPIYLSNLTLLCSTAPGAAVAGENLLGTGLNLILFYMCNGSMVNRHLRHINRVRATGSILMANSISERSGYVAVRESKFIVASANRFVPCWLINHSSSSRLVYGVVGGPHLPCVLMRRLAAEPEDGLESDLDGAELEPVDGFAASAFLSSAFTALSVAVSFFW